MLGYAILQHWIPGELTCVTKTKKRGYRKFCIVKCSDGKKRKGPKRIRCKGYDNRGGTAFNYWHTTKKKTKISCN